MTDGIVYDDNGAYLYDRNKPKDKWTQDEKAALFVNVILGLDDNCRTLRTDLDNLRRERNQRSREYAAQMKAR